MAGRAVVAMSGGVDSSVAAALMAQAGFDCVGVTLKLLPRADSGFGCCGSPVDIDDARRVCERLGIPHYVLNLSDLFEDKVVRPFIDAYVSARTPNPCVECNRSVKFGHLLGLARAWGAECVATGHYARVQGARLYAAKDERKDQTYFLYSLTARELSGVRFPVGDLAKDEVRARARELGLKTADKPESQEICFVPGRDYRAFLEGRLGPVPSLEPGPIQDTDGRTVGRHDGVASYTVGQRKGLGGGAGGARYVVRLEAGSNTVVVGRDEETFAAALSVSGVSWTGRAAEEPFIARVRIRHRHSPAPARVTPQSDGGALVEFDSPQRAATQGQAAVFYDGQEVLGGGTIARVLRPAGRAS